jgi:PPP family 3-phenylpropionic acid transporter
MQGLPEAERRRPSEPAPTPGASPLRSPAFRLLCATTLCLHASHAVLYGFASTTWRFAGIDEGTIGWLWAVGVVAEIGLFTWARAVGRRLSPALLLAMAGLGGVLRWPILAVTVSVPILFASSLLHAATFAAMHLGAMEFIRAHVPPESTARATAIYSATSGIALGLGLPIAGALVDAVGQQAFFAMAVVSGAGLVLALLLDRRVRARAC